MSKASRTGRLAAKNRIRRALLRVDVFATCFDNTPGLLDRVCFGLASKHRDVLTYAAAEIDAIDIVLSEFDDLDFTVGGPWFADLFVARYRGQDVRCFLNDRRRALRSNSFASLFTPAA